VGVPVFTEARLGTDRAVDDVDHRNAGDSIDEVVVVSFTAISGIHEIVAVAHVLSQPPYLIQEAGCELPRHSFFWKTSTAGHQPYRRGCRTWASGRR